ncbi:mitotic interactor and substrate of PLK1 [Cynocephalus volans]|uniref:mitotic interactor and substrate of PLK1 n=1 Tax=Cynocephalus volans TaxID=110931 RepID=UPI002FCBEF0F
MDRVTRYPIFSIPRSPRISGLALDGDTSYTFQLVGVGPEGWGQDEPQAWPTDHEARLNMVTTGPWAFSSELSPRPLHPEDNDSEEMKAYRLDAGVALARRPRDLEREHCAVIQGQTVRKSGTVATLRDTPEHRDPRTRSQDPRTPRSTPLEDNMVDREQIDFLAARQQFLSLEQANAGAPQSPLARVAPAYAPPGVSQAPEALNWPQLTNGYVVSNKPQVKEVVWEEKTVCGLPTGPSVRAVDYSGSWCQVESLESPMETPIEREIRLAQEREADLRKQRGLQQASGHQELVEIPTRPLLTKVSLATAPRGDRGRPSLYVQRDIVQETQREEDHRRKGVQVSWAATPDCVSKDPPPELRRALSSDSILSPAPDARAASPAPEVRKVNRIPPEAYQPYLNPGTPRLEFPAFGVYSKSNGLSTEEAKVMASPKATGSPRHLLESSGKPLSTKQEYLKPPGGPLQANEGIVQWENFRLRPLKFGVPDVPQQAEASHVQGWDVAGAPVVRPQRSLSSDLLEREVESVLRREREVAEERRNALFPKVTSPPPKNGPDQDSRHSSQASGITGSYSVSESPVFTPVHLHSGLVWTAEEPADRAPRQRKRKDLWYAGISPTDGINSEILEATRVTRHKNAMAERWESGIYTSEDEN